MTSDQEQFLKAFKGKVLKLKSYCREVTRQNEKLSMEIENLKGQNRRTEEALHQLESKYNGLKMAESIASGSGDLGELKETVKRMMREIDGCITLLND